MKIRRAIFLSILAFLPTETYARDIWVLHKEENKFIVDHFRQNEGEMQNRISENIFSSMKNAEDFLREKNASYQEGDQFELNKENSFHPITEISSEKIWETKNDWSVEWEKKYKDWLEENANSTFLYKNNIATDCADVAYAYRWIFSRINFLPAANHLGGTGDIFTNESMKKEWESLPTSAKWNQDRRFLAALNYLLENTYTHTLMQDLYPIAVDQIQLSAGSIYLDLYSESTGHTQFVRSMILDPSHPAPLRMIASTIPREVRELDEYGFDGLGHKPENGKEGFWRFRWAKKMAQDWQIAPKEKMPGYSLEQFGEDFMGNEADLNRVVVKKLMPRWAPNPMLLMRGLVAQAMKKLKERVKIVEDGYAYCSTNSCEPNSSAYELWSTPSRDRAIANLIQGIYTLYYDNVCDNFCRVEFSRNESTTITTVDGNEINFSNAVEIWMDSDYSSDPNDQISRRWGIN